MRKTHNARSQGSFRSRRIFVRPHNRIGRPPRPLSLKRSNGAGTTQFAPVHAQDALESAAAAGYSHVEVHIHMNDSTVAQIRAELAHPTHHRANRPMFDARDTIAKYVFHGTDGSFTLEPPL